MAGIKRSQTAAFDPQLPSSDDGEKQIARRPAKKRSNPALPPPAKRLAARKPGSRKRSQGFDDDDDHEDNPDGSLRSVNASGGQIKGVGPNGSHNHGTGEQLSSTVEKTPKGKSICSTKGSQVASKHPSQHPLADWVAGITKHEYDIYCAFLNELESSDVDSRQMDDPNHRLSALVTRFVLNTHNDFVYGILTEQRSEVQDAK